MLIATIALALASNTFGPANTMPPSTSCYIHGHPPYSEFDAVSPELHWSGAPQNTQSYALLMVDTDYQSRLHWLVYDVPAGAQSLPEGAALVNPPRTGTGTEPRRYMGACPPHGQTHHYAITLFALDVPKLPGWPAGTPAFMRMINGHVLARGVLTGVFTAP